MTTTSTQQARAPGTFIATKEHRRFVEFADAVRRERYIGLCFGPAGVGKTLSARRYAQWDAAEALLEEWGPRDAGDAAVCGALAESRTALYTPSTVGSRQQLASDLATLTTRVDTCIHEHVALDRHVVPRGRRRYLELVIVDEAERLSPAALEHLRDRFDREHFGLLLIGMPGIAKRLARYPQLYSRIGFAHLYRPLTDEELAFVLTRHWQRLGLTLDLTDFTDAQAVAAVGRITRGNFRLVHRLFAQIERVLGINDLSVITSDVVETARSALVIGEA